MSNKEQATRQFQFLQKFLNSSRKSTNEKSSSKQSKSGDSEKPVDWLTKKAIDELHKEMTINNVKRKAFGTVAAPKAKTNKRFLQATLGQVLSHNKRELNRTQEKSTDKLKELDRDRRRSDVRSKSREKSPEKLKKNDRKRHKDKKLKFGDRKHKFKKPKKKKRRDSSSSSSED